jgi:hypothetical protein
LQQHCLIFASFVRNAALGGNLPIGGWGLGCPDPCIFPFRADLV